MFKFPLYTINTPTLALLLNGFEVAHRNTGNTIYLYLARLLGVEMTRRQAGITDHDDTLITLPLGDATAVDVVQAAGFALTAQPPDKTASVARFLDAVFFEIQAAAQRLHCATLN